MSGTPHKSVTLRLALVRTFFAILVEQTLLIYFETKHARNIGLLWFGWNHILQRENVSVLVAMCWALCRNTTVDYSPRRTG